MRQGRGDALTDVFERWHFFRTFVEPGRVVVAGTGDGQLQFIDP